MLFSPGYPGFVRGVVTSGPGEFVVTTSGGQVTRYRPAASESEVLADGFDQLYGVALGPGGPNNVVFTELGTGRLLSVRSGDIQVLATDLRDPIGVAVDADGTCLVAQAGAGTVVRVDGSVVDTLVADLQRPQGILVRDGVLYIVDAGAKKVIAFDLNSKTQQTIASGLPVGPPPGVTPKPLRGMPPFSGPQGPFAGITAGPDGTLYISADGDGSILALHRTQDGR
jgi:DNA-binding beta-propeller fold protein YncE